MMKRQSLLVIALLLVVMLLLSLTALAAPLRYRVQSKIGGTQFGATQEIGHFRARMDRPRRFRVAPTSFPARRIRRLATGFTSKESAPATKRPLRFLNAAGMAR